METHRSPLRPRGRPPRHVEGLLDTRERLLRTGVEVLTEKGFSATGIDQILRRAARAKLERNPAPLQIFATGFFVGLRCR